MVNPFSTSKARVMILKAEGKHFTAGLDLNSAMDATNFPEDEEGNEPDTARKALYIQEHVLAL